MAMDYAIHSDALEVPPWCVAFGDRSTHRDAMNAECLSCYGWASQSVNTVEVAFGRGGDW